MKIGGFPSFLNSTDPPLDTESHRFNKQNSLIFHNKDEVHFGTRLRSTIKKSPNRSLMRKSLDRIVVRTRFKQLEQLRQLKNKAANLTQNSPDSPELQKIETQLRALKKKLKLNSVAHSHKIMEIGSEKVNAAQLRQWGKDPRAGDLANVDELINDAMRERNLPIVKAFCEPGSYFNLHKAIANHLLPESEDDFRDLHPALHWFDIYVAQQREGISSDNYRKRVIRKLRRMGLPSIRFNDKACHLIGNSICL
jgi:hypothetical protein